MTKLNEIMKQKKITSQELSELTGINQRTIDEYRQGRRRRMTFENGIKISDALKIDPHELVEKGE